MEESERTVADQIGRSAVIISGVLVALVLITNMVSLALSFDPVFDESPEVYDSGINGYAHLPYLPGDISEFKVEFPETVPEASPFMINVTAVSGKVPSLPLFIEFMNGSAKRYDLFDSFSDSGWSAFTVIPGDIPPGSYGVSMGYRDLEEHHRIGNFFSVLEVLPGDGVAIHPVLDGSLSTGGSLSVVTSDGSLVPGIMLEDGTSIEMIDSGNGTFTIEGDEPEGWQYFDLQIVGGNISTGPFLADFGSNKTLSFPDPEINLDQPFSDYDELYGQKPEDIRVNGSSDDPELLTSTYYSVDLDLYDPVEGIRKMPLPFVYLTLEGRTNVLRPYDGNGGYRGMVRTVGSYNDDRDDGLKLRINGMDEGSTLLDKDLLLKDRQSPGLRLIPDPFSDPLSAMNGTVLEMEEGWELVTYRDFASQPDLSIDGIGMDTERFIEDSDEGDRIIYSSGRFLSGGLLGQRMDISSKAEFRMQVSISFIFISFPYKLVGELVPAWFVFISCAITLSLGFLAWRSFKKTRDGIHPWVRGGHPFDTDNDLFSLSTTYMGALFFSWVVVIMFQFMEQPTPVPSILSDETPIWIRMILLADASVWEEVVSRVMFIGLPLLFLHPTGKWDIRRFKVLLGGKGSFGMAEVVLILISSSFFGLAHIGWGPWKVIPTFVTGALFGYLYIKVGLHAAIAMHFLFDYDGFIYDLVDYPSIQLFAVYYFALLFGGLFLARILVRFKDWIIERSNRTMDRKWILILHSVLVLLVIIYGIVTGDVNDYSLALAMVPLLNGAALLFQRSKVGLLPEVLVAVSSLISLALAPLGFMWIMDRERTLKKTLS